MQNNTIGSHEPALVSPQDFLDRMSLLWAAPPFSMNTTPALEAGWSVLVEHFHRAASSNLSSAEQKRSYALPLPTGSGKTEGTCVYAALQADRNLNHPDPVGVLIVTRLIVDADKVAEKINSMAGRRVAVAHHSEHKLTSSEMAEFDVLVITHAAFRDAAEAFGAHAPERWNVYYQWSRGTRSLIVVDEALANAVDHNAATSADLDVVLRAIPHELRAQHPLALTALEKLKSYLDRKERDQEPGSALSQMLWGEGAPAYVEQIRGLRGALKATAFDLTLFNAEAPDTVDSILGDVEVMLDSYAYYYRSGAQHSLNSSRYLIPRGMPGIVILDATANSNVLYELLEEARAGAVSVVPVPGGIRNYSNVTLHVARTTAGLGKSKMKDTKHLRIPRLVQEVANEVGQGRKVFMCVHKLSKDLLTTFSTPELPLDIGWWGAVDGKNDWADCDVAVIFGLPYMDPRRAIGSVLAVNGPQDNAWLQSPPPYNEHANIPDMLAIRDVAASVVQAINRVRCRRIVDCSGRCEKTDVYIVLPTDWRGDTVMEHIRLNMPGIHAVPWDFEPDGPKVYAPRCNSANEAVIGLMRDRKPGAVPMSHVQRELSLSKRQMARVKEDLAKDTSKITAALREEGVIYRVEGRGRGTKSYLVKAA
ncbi:Arc/MetJ family transcription regulator [Bradyrhizobium ottawaense]